MINFWSDIIQSVNDSSYFLEKLPIKNSEPKVKVNAVKKISLAIP